MRRFVLSFVLSNCVLAFCSDLRAQDPPVPVAPESPAPAAVAAAEAASEPVSAVAACQQIRVPDLTGEWCGSWFSCVNGHKGPMRARFCRLCNGNYEVTFTGRFCKLIPFRYTTTLNVTGYTDGVVYLSGSQHLGPVFGTFSYNAWANDRQFVSGYSAGTKDQGQFVMQR